nr:hypothetical protein [Tanacetum cinerariifolium]
MNKLPIKSLLWFRMVSKSWKITIDSNIFVCEYASRQCAMCYFTLKYDMDIPTQLKNDLPVPFYIFKLGNSLVILGNHIDNDENRYICAWLLEVEAAVVTSWRVLFVMSSQNIAKLIGFTMDGDPIVVDDMGHEIVHTLQVYDRLSQQFHTLLIVDYDLWEVTENGETLPHTQVVEGVTIVMPISSVEDKAQRKLEVKVRITLMISIPNEHQLKFNYIKDAKQLLEAIKKRFGRNAAIKKTQRNLLNQQYENFTASNSAMLDQTFDRLQKLMSQLDLLGKKLSQEDVNQNAATAIKRRHFAKECRAPRNKDTKHKESIRRSVLVETSVSIDLVSCDGLGGYDLSDQAEEGPNYTLMAFTSSSSDDEFADKPVAENTKFTKEETKAVRKNTDAPTIEEWVSDDEEENLAQPKIVNKTVKPNIVKKEFVKPRQKEKTTRKTIKKLSTIGKTLIDLEAIKKTGII